MNRKSNPFVVSLSNHIELHKKIIFLFLTIFTAHTFATLSIETGMKYQKSEQFPEAITYYKNMLQQNPRDIAIHFNLGCCYLAIGEFENAIAAFQYIVDEQPSIMAAKYNLAYTYKTMGDVDTAIQLYKEIIEADPDYEQAQLGLGFAYITQGNLEHGWQQHERHLSQTGKNGDALRALLKNDTVPYKRVLLRPEGGLGDTINFIRYAERLKDMGADVMVSCQAQLIPLLSRCTYIDQLLPCGMPQPEHDAEATLMSLPAIFADTQDTVPLDIPYIHPDPALVQYWQKQLAHDSNFKIGICWQVDVHNDESKLPIGRRGIPLKHFAVLKNIPGVSFYSLQKHDGVEQCTTLPDDFNLHIFNDLDEKSGPFMDTAAIMKNLDLIITVDTAIVHLAGAMGCKVWLLHPYATADWRWICHRTDSYWYPTVRIFKQHKAFDYDGILQDVYDALCELRAAQE